MANTILGTDGDDFLVGDSNLFDREDVIIGKQGNDTITGGERNDRLEGQSGNDLLFGGADQDGLHGGLGNDLLVAGIFVRNIHSDGTPGESLYGGGGNDTIYAGGGDNVYADSGNDTVYIGPALANEVTRISAGAGADIIYGTTLREDIRGGGGNDEIYSGTQDPGGFDAEGDRIRAGSGNDIIVASSQADDIRGGAGHDYIDAGAGSETIYGDNGNDTLLAGIGDDVLNGGNGEDTASYVGGAGAFVDLRDGSSTDSNLGSDTLVRIENVVGSVNFDVIMGNRFDNVLDGAGGTDIINGHGGNDTLLGGAGDDVLNGGAGIDGLFGGSGDDVLNGGGGPDIIDGGSNTAAGDTVTYLSETGPSIIDIAQGFANVDGVIDTVTNVENVIGTNQDDIISGNGASNVLRGMDGTDFLFGGGGADELYGGDDPDLLFGGGGNDFLQGDDGPDLLFGGAGIDFLGGGAGDDSLAGGPGGDPLAGGPGSDTYSWAADDLSTLAGSEDLIGGFELGMDRFEFINIVDPSFNQNTDPILDVLNASNLGNDTLLTVYDGSTFYHFATLVGVTINNMDLVAMNFVGDIDIS